MTEPTETTDAAAPPTDQTRAIVVQRERLLTEAPMAMFDSAAFEHLQRVATVIYRSGFAPKSLTHEGLGDNAEPLPEPVVVARMVMLADQAQRAGADVIGYIQATSVINGRLMYEGKLVNAIVQRRLGIRLKYRFGLWDTDHINFPEVDKDGAPVDPKFFHGAAERLAVRAYNPNSPDEYVEGSVGQWKTTRAGNPWTKQADWPRQLRYRAVREWARAYDPGTVLGMIADGDEEVDTVQIVQPTGPGVMARLSGHQNGEGFDPDNGNGHTAEGHAGVKAKRAARRKGPEALPAPEAESPATPAAETVAEALDGDDLPKGLRPTSAEAPTATDGAPTAEPEPTTSGSAELASEDIPETEEELSPPDQDGDIYGTVDVISEGYPNENEIYMLNGDGWNFDIERGAYRRDTYKNGEPFSDAGRDKGYRIYEDHKPQHASSEEPEIDTAPEEEPADDFPPDFAAFIDAIEGEKAVNSWAEVKTALQEFMKGPTWAGMDEQHRNRQRGTTWSALTERKVEWLPSPALDLSAFRLWLETAPTALQAKQTFDALTETETFKNAAEATRKAIIGAVAARLDYLKGA